MRRLNTRRIMHEFLIEYGCLSLFLLSFLASTLLPVGSEWLLVMLLMEGYGVMPVMAAATIGNTLGACTTYAIGFYGGPLLVEKWLHISGNALHRGGRIYHRYGVWSLLFTWVPFIGDPLCVAGGIFRTRMSVFLLLVSIGKLARYAFVAWLTVLAR